MEKLYNEVHAIMDPDTHQVKGLPPPGSALLLIAATLADDDSRIVPPTDVFTREYGIAPPEVEQAFDRLCEMGILGKTMDGGKIREYRFMPDFASHYHA